MAAHPTKKQSWFGWCMYDWANSALATVLLAALLTVYFVSLVPAEDAGISFPGLRRIFRATSLRGYAVHVPHAHRGCDFPLPWKSGR